MIQNLKARLGVALGAVQSQCVRTKIHMVGFLSGLANLKLVENAVVATVVEIQRWIREMIRSIDKGVKAAELTRPPVGVYGDVDLRVIPKFVSYRAALLREKYGLHFILGAVCLLWVSTFVVQNNRLDYWQTKYREKEFILVPSTIVGHTPAVPQTVPDSYVDNAVRFFVELLGNTTPTDVEEHYERFSHYMTAQLRAQFLAETGNWRQTARTENIYEQVEIQPFTWKSDGRGGYDVDVPLRRDRRVGGELVGSVQESVKMHLQLVPPQGETEWIFEIKEFSRKSETKSH